MLLKCARRGNFLGRRKASNPFFDPALREDVPPTHFDPRFRFNRAVHPTIAGEPLRSFFTRESTTLEPLCSKELKRQRAYARPIMATGGSPLGVLFALNRMPRTLSPKPLPSDP